MKKYLYLSNKEFRLLLYALIEFKNKLSSQGRYTDAIDDVIINLIR